MDQGLDLREQMAGTCQDQGAGRRRCDAPAGSVKQTRTQSGLKAGERAGDGGLRDAQFQRGVGEAAGVDDRHQAAQLLQLKIHAYIV